MITAIAPARPRPASVPPGIASAVFAFAVLSVTAAAGGAYLPVTWGWVALGPLVAALAVAVSSDRVEVGRADKVFLGALALLVVWTALSTLWSESVPRSVSEVERDLVYLSVAASALVLTARSGVAWLTAGTAAGATAICGFGLTTRLFPDYFGLDVDFSYRLARPLGYWNGLGLVGAMGLLLTLGIAASAARMPVRAAASAATVVLASALYFTFSRGAWLAFLVGILVMLAAARNRSALTAHVAAVAPFLCAAVWACSRPGALNDARTTLADASSAGHWLALVVAALALAAAFAPVVCHRLRQLRVPTALTRGVLLGALAAALAVSAVVLVHAGGPGGVWSRALAAFGASGWSPSTRPADGLFSGSGRGRIDYWRVAWQDVEVHPWLGSGAGTFEVRWTRERPVEVGARDAHSLYLETLAELGPAGLALLLAVLAVPFVALKRARGSPEAAPAAGAFAAFVAAAGIDWHWELPTVTLTAVCAVAILLAAARLDAAPTAGLEGGRAGRAFAIVSLAALAAVALVIQLGNSAIQDARDAAGRGESHQAAASARRAMLLAPWAAAPWRVMATGQLAAGDLAGARASLATAVSRDPADWELWYALSNASAGSSSRQALDVARRLNPLGLAVTGNAAAR